jgi:alkylation response protein AidB-like acyl-CoA dehydrogenase
VVVRTGDRLVVVATAGQEVRPVANLGSQPLADLVVDDTAIEIASGRAAADLHAVAVDEWLALTASALVGIGARALDLATAYAVERRAWGVPIGTFQAVSHPLADSATALDGARLLARKAAWAADVDDGRRAELAAMAFGFAAETARDATYRSLHVHGGYGFMLEQDVQLLYRRARGWARVWGDTRRAYRRAATHRYGGGR